MGLIGWRLISRRIAVGRRLALLGATLGVAAATLSAVSAPAASAVTASVPPLHSLDGVACISARECIAVGDAAHRSLAEWWNGSKWSLVVLPLPAAARGSGSSSSLSGVSCGSARSCVATGWYYHSSTSAAVPLVETWNGIRWSAATLPAPRGSGDVQPQGIACPSAKSCIVVGDYLPVPRDYGNDAPLAESWNGSKWTLATVGRTGYLAGVSCWSQGHCVAVGFSGDKQLVTTLNGSKWASVKSPTPAGSSASLNAVACASAKTCLAVGRAISSAGWAAFAEVLRVGKWTVSKPPAPAKGPDLLVDPMGVSCSSPTWCTVVGEYGGAGYELGTTYAQSWNGSRWKTLAVPAVPGVSAGNGSVLEGVRCLSAANCIAVGQYGQGNGYGWAYSALWNGRGWRLVRAV